MKYRRNIEALASSALCRKAGLDTVLNALRDYRLACVDDNVCVAPVFAFDVDKCDWLWTDEPQDET